MKHCNEVGLAGFRIPDWDDYKAEFQKNGWFDSKVEKPEAWGTYRRYQVGTNAVNGDFPPLPPEAQHQGWNTTTHKQEIWSLLLESWLVNGAGNDGVRPNLPYSDTEQFSDKEMFPLFVEAPHGPVADPDLFADENSFLMTTGRRQGTYFHSEHRQLPWCRELWPAPRLEMNPADAEKLGLKQGDWAWIETEWGKVRQCVDLYHGIAPGWANAEHAWWFPELPAPTHGFTLSNIECIWDPYGQDTHISSHHMRGVPVKIYKATPENCPDGKVIPCAPEDGTQIICDASDPRLKEWLPNYDIREEA